MEERGGVVWVGVGKSWVAPLNVKMARNGAELNG